MDERAAESRTDDAELWEQVRRLTELVAHQQRRLDQLDPPATDAARNPLLDPTPLAEVDDVTDRRALLRRAGLAAAGAVTGGVALAAASAGPAAAANNDPVLVGQTTLGTATTSLTWSGGNIPDTGPAVLMVKDFNTAVLNNVGATLVAYRVGGGADSRAVGGVNTGDGIGVYGKGDTGVHAEGAAGGTGLRAEGGYAVEATSAIVGGVGVAVSAAHTHLLLTPGPADPNVPSGPRLAGSVVNDSTSALWLCTSGGTPGTWRKLGGPGTAGQLHFLPAPKRVFDSRAGFAPANSDKGAFFDQTKVIDAKNNGSGVPAGATAVLVNFAVTNTNSGGFGALWANGVADPGTANLNWSSPSTSISNSVASAVDANALLQCKIAGLADVIIDVIGYWR